MPFGWQAITKVVLVGAGLAPALLTAHSHATAEAGPAPQTFTCQGRGEPSPYITNLIR